MTSITVHEPQSRDMRKIKQMTSVPSFVTINLTKL